MRPGLMTTDSTDNGGSRETTPLQRASIGMDDDEGSETTVRGTAVVSLVCWEALCTGLDEILDMLVSACIVQEVAMSGAVK